MQRTKAQLEAEAIDWVIRLRSAKAEDWEDFTLWLEADSANREAYDEVALADEDFGHLPMRGPRSPLQAETAAGHDRVGRRGFIAMFAVAALAGVAGYIALQTGEAFYAVETAPGERRTLELADGSRIALNGSTKIHLGRDEVRFARLEEGEALFIIAHDSSQPFQVKAGDSLIQVAGTVFNVIYTRHLTHVGVAEGAVIFNPGSEGVKLTPSMILRKEGQETSVMRSAPAEIGSWREGRLSYISATFGQIAADLSRNTGIHVQATPEVASRRFSGLIVLEGDADQLFRRLSALLGVEARRSEEGWVLTAEPSDTP